MDGACKAWWYKDKMMSVSQKGYFCLFQPYTLTINYRCLEDILLIFGSSWAQNTILPIKKVVKYIRVHREGLFSCNNTQE